MESQNIPAIAVEHVVGAGDGPAIAGRFTVKVVRNATTGARFITAVGLVFEYPAGETSPVKADGAGSFRFSPALETATLKAWAIAGGLTDPALAHRLSAINAAAAAAASDSRAFAVRLPAIAGEGGDLAEVKRQALAYVRSA